MSKRKHGKETKEIIRSKGFYSGTTVGNSFLRMYKEDESQDRGYAEIYLTRNMLVIRRYLSLKPLEIPTRAISRVSFGHFHAGRPALRPIMKIFWVRKGQELVTGFIIKDSTRPDVLLSWQRKLQRVVKGKFL